MESKIPAKGMAVQSGINPTGLALLFPWDSDAMDVVITQLKGDVEVFWSAKWPIVCGT